MSTIAAAPAAESKPLYTSLFVQVLAALILASSSACSSPTLPSASRS